jgi:DNA uptake protein ComE-like DNA-binding protein
MRFLAAAVLAAALTLPAAAHAQVGKGLLDPNVATEQELAALPGMTPALVKAVIAARPFADAVAFDAVLKPVLDSAARVAVYRKAFVHVNLDAAPREAIALIPDIGRRMIGEFLEYRPYDGGLVEFRKEIGKYVRNKPGELERLEQYVFVPMDLNTASDEDLLTIPGLGPRMLREFKEYRPYDGMAKFRREIGKYVDAKEVERLARYVRVGGTGKSN